MFNVVRDWHPLLPECAGREHGDVIVAHGQWATTTTVQHNVPVAVAPVKPLRDHRVSLCWVSPGSTDTKFMLLPA